MTIAAPIELQATRVQDTNLLRSFGFQFEASLSHSHKIKGSSGIVSIVKSSLSKTGSRLDSEHNKKRTNGEIEEEIWVASLDPRSLRLWKDFHEVRRLVFPTGKSEFLSTVLQIPEKHVIVATAADLSCKFYDIHTLEYVGSVPLHQRAVYDLKYLHGSQELVSAGVNGVTLWSWSEHKTEVWDAQSKLWKSVTVHDLRPRLVLSDSNWARKVEVDENSQKIYVLKDDDIHIFHSQTGTKCYSLHHLHKHPVTCCIAYEDSHYLVTGSAGGEICVWTDAEHQVLVHTFRSHSKGITNLCHHPTPNESGLIISSSMDGIISVLSLDLLQERYRFQVGNEGCSNIQVMPNQHLLVTVGCKLELWKLQHLTAPFAPERAPISHLLSLPETEQVLVHSMDGSIRLVNSTSGDTTCRIVPNSKLDSVRQVAFDEESQYIFVLLSSSKIIIYDASHDPALVAGFWQHIKPHKDEICTIAVTPRFLVGGSARGSLFFWDLCRESYGELRHQFLTVHESPITNFAIRDELLVITSTIAGVDAVSVWDMQEWACLGKIDLSGWTPISCVAVSQERPLAYLGLQSGESLLVDLESVTLISGISQDHAHEGMVSAAVFVDPLRILLSVGVDGRLKVWNERKRLIRMLDIHGDPIHALTVLNHGLGEILLGERNNVVCVRAKDAFPERYEKLRKQLLHKIVCHENLYRTLNETSASVASEFFEASHDMSSSSGIISSDELSNADLLMHTPLVARSNSSRLDSISEDQEAFIAPAQHETDLDIADLKRPGGFISVFSYELERKSAAKVLENLNISEPVPQNGPPKILSTEGFEVAQQKASQGPESHLNLEDTTNVPYAQSSKNNQCDEDTDGVTDSGGVPLIRLIDPTTGLLRSSTPHNSNENINIKKRRSRRRKNSRKKEKMSKRKLKGLKIQSLRPPTDIIGDTAARKALIPHRVSTRSLTSEYASSVSTGSSSQQSLVPHVPHQPRSISVKLSPRLIHLQAMLEASMDDSQRPKAC